MRRLLLPAVLGLVPVTAAARTPEPQQNEVRIDMDIRVERGGNGAFFDAQYTFTPGGVNRTDEVVPLLRRFVRHPSALWLRVQRDGNTREQITGAKAGGVLQLADGLVYGSAEGGIENDAVDYDPFEVGYWALPVTGEVGFRPTPLLSVGGFYQGRFILNATTDRAVKNPAERSGTEQRFGVTSTLATPNDRVYATVSAWLARSDWTFEGFHPGDMTARGYGASVRLALQTSSTFTIQLRGQIRAENWVNSRLGDDNPSFVGEDIDRNLIFASGNLDVIYWHRGRYGFRAGFGGGFESAPPTLNNRDTGIFSLTLGIVMRF